MRNLILVSLLALPLSGCLAAGAAVGVVASTQMMDNHVYSSHINQDAKEVWEVSKKFLSESSKELIDYDDQLRVAEANIDGSRVKLSVEAWDVDKCVLHVEAKKYLSTINDGEMARVVMERLHRRLGG
jgi:hypothetical protein